MQIRDFITSLDSSAPKPLEEFHFDKGSYNKTFIGGCLSIAASLFLAYFLYFEFVSMQARDGTKFTSVNTKYEEKVNIEAFEMPMFIFGLEDTSIEEFVEIDQTKISAVQIQWVDEMALHRHENVKSTTLRKCQESDFRTAQQKYYYQAYHFWEGAYYCLDTEDWFYTGSFEGQDHDESTFKYRYLSLFITKCSEENSKDVTCSSKEKIDEWLEYKHLKVWDINQEFDRKNYEAEYPVIETLELQIGSLSLKPGLYHEVQVGFTMNDVLTKDSWWNIVSKGS